MLALASLHHKLLTRWGEATALPGHSARLSACACVQAPKVEAPDSDAESEGDEEARKSKKKRKLEARLKIADLKQACARPEVVEVWDVTAQDPKLLVFLKVRSLAVGAYPPKSSSWLQAVKLSATCAGVQKLCARAAPLVAEAEVSAREEGH